MIFLNPREEITEATLHLYNIRVAWNCVRCGWMQLEDTLIQNQIRTHGVVGLRCDRCGLVRKGEIRIGQVWPVTGTRWRMMNDKFSRIKKNWEKIERKKLKRKTKKSKKKQRKLFR